MTDAGQFGRRVSDVVWGPPRPDEDSPVAITKRREQQLDHRFAAASAAAESQASALTERFEQQLAELEQRVGERTCDAFAAITQRLDAIEARFVAEASRLDDLTALSTRLDDVLGAMNIADTERREQVEAFRGELAAARRQLDHIGPLRERSAALTQSSAELLEEFREYQHTVATRWEQMSARVTEVEESVGSDGMAAIEAHLDRMEDLERAVAEINPDLFVRKGELRAGI